MEEMMSMMMMGNMMSMDEDIFGGGMGGMMGPDFDKMMMDELKKDKKKDSKKKDKAKEKEKKK